MNCAPNLESRFANYQNNPIKPPSALVENPMVFVSGASVVKQFQKP